MLRKTIFASTTAALCFATFAASTSASAAPMNRGLGIYARPVLLTHGSRHIGTGGLTARPNAGRPRCWDAECGGGVAPIDARFVIRGCQFMKGEALPPFCQGIPPVAHGKTRGLRN